jgi:hypothetical protein
MCQSTASLRGRRKRVRRNGYFAEAEVAEQTSKNEFAHIVVKR